MHDPLAAALGGGIRTDRLQDRRPTRAAEEGHAQRPQILFRKLLNEEQRNDVRVLQASQRQMFVPGAGRQLDDQRSVGEQGLRRQKNSSGAAATQLAQQPELAKFLAGRGKNGRVGMHQAMAGENDAQCVAELRKAAIELRRIDSLAPFLS